MALIVVMEDDAGTRKLVCSVLQKDGHEVADAEDGAAGLEMVFELRPDLVISDVQMPKVNGFEMLEAVRKNPAVASTPVILLTSLQERAHMRIGMNTGADDYITKPFRPAELREAVAAQLNKLLMQASVRAMEVGTAVQTALEEQQVRLGDLYEKRLATELSERWPTGDPQAGDEKFDSATVLFAGIPEYAAMAQQLNPTELSGVVKKFYSSAGDTIHLFGARHMRFVGEGLLAIFVDNQDTESVNHGLRAARTALGLVDSSRAMRQYTATQFAGRNLPPFNVTVALHSGAVTLTHIAEDPLYGTPAQILPVGEAINVTMAMLKASKAQKWAITASAAMLRSVTGGVKTGGRAMLDMPGGSAPLDAAELTGLAL